MLLTITSFAAPWDIKSPKQKVLAWDKPLVKTEKKLFNLPNVEYIYASYEAGSGLHCAIVLTGSDINPSNGDLKAIIKVRSGFRQINGTIQWSWHQYTIYMPYDGVSNAWGQVFYVNPLTEYQGWHYPNGDVDIDSDQYYLYYYGPQ